MTALIGIAAVALALVSAACGGGGGKGDSDGVASLGGNSQQSPNGNEQGEADPEDAMLAFARCMREHGVDIPDPSRSGGGFRFRSGAQGPDPSSAKFREAERACQRFLEQAKPLNLSEEDRAAMQDAALEYAKCMRRNGVDMPDPDFSGPGVKMQLPRGVGPDNPRFEAAQKACQSILQDARRKAGLGEGRLEQRGPGGK